MRSRLEPGSAARADAPDPSPAHGARLDAASRAIVLAAAAALPAAVVLRGPFAWACAIGAAIACGGAALTGRRLAALTALLSALTIAALTVPALTQLPPTPFLLALGITLAAAAASGPTTPPWLRRGAWSAAVSGRVVAIVAVSALGLLLWYRLVRPDVSANLAMLPPWGGAWLALVAVGWACLNAVAEELAFRGAFQHALGEAFGVRVALVLQAAAFGLVHFRGFPGGWSGALLAGTYGLMLGELRDRSRGLLAPWAAHVAADVVIIGIVVLLGR